MEMEAHLAGRPAAHLARRVDDGPAACSNNLEASMSKAKAGLVVTQVTQKAVEMLGPLGYSRKLPAREVDARRQDQRHLRGHAADQPDDHRAAHPGVLEQGAVAERAERAATLRRPGAV